MPSCGERRIRKSLVYEHISRRQALAASGVLVASCNRPTRSPIEPVLITRAPAYDAPLYQAVRDILAEHRLDLRGKNVLLKPNLVEFDADNVINTNPVLVHAVFEACRAQGVSSVRIAEGPGHRRTTLDLADAAGYFSVIPGFEQTFTDLNLDDVSLVKFANPHSKLSELYLPHVARAADLIISIPKMKTHHWVGATLSMKNFFGLVPGAVYGWPKNILHWAGIDECIADLHSVFPRHFAIVDGIEAMQGNGPIQGSRKHAGVIISGRDLVAVDATCCRIMGINPRQIRYLELASTGQTSEDNVPQLGVTIDSVRTPFAVVPQLQHILIGQAPA